MIVGITGSICAGKSELAKYLVKTYNFEAVNIQDIFKCKLREIIKAKQKARKKKEAIKYE